MMRLAPGLDENGRPIRRCGRGGCSSLPAADFRRIRWRACVVRPGCGQVVRPSEPVLDTFFGCAIPMPARGVRVFEGRLPGDAGGGSASRLKAGGSRGNPASPQPSHPSISRRQKPGRRTKGRRFFRLIARRFSSGSAWVPYLTPRGRFSLTLDFIAGVPASEVVFDYPSRLKNYSGRSPRSM